MADKVTNELLLEHLKAIQAKLGLLASDLADAKSDLRGIKSHLAGFMESEVAQDGALAALQARLDRVERRLEIN